MFEITRHDPFGLSPVRDLINLVRRDPFFDTPFETPDAETLAVDVSEKDGEVIVRASLPGFDKDDVHVQIEDGTLSITAEHKEESTDEHERYYRRERRVQSLMRRVSLPGKVTDANATADLTDGVLTLRIPQAAEARPKEITVN
jgi:HSP20 family protein